jgi:hypothetical protein
LEVAELGSSITGRGKNATTVASLPEFNTFLSKISDEQILITWEKAEQALNKAQNARNITDSTRQAVISKLEGDIRNIEAIASARESWKRKRIPSKIGSEQFKAQQRSIGQADLASIIESESKAKSLTSQPVSENQLPRIQVGKVDAKNKNVANSISYLISGAVSRQMQREEK